jgi:hypothetical protein
MGLCTGLRLISWEDYLQFFPFSDINRVLFGDCLSESGILDRVLDCPCCRENLLLGQGILSCTVPPRGMSEEVSLDVARTHTNGQSQQLLATICNRHEVSRVIP